MIVYRPTYQCKKSGQTKQTTNWYFRHRGKRYPTHIPDKRAAEAKAREMITQMELGYNPRQHELAKTECLQTLIQIYTTQLDAGETQKYLLGHRLGKIAAELKAVTLGEFTTEKVQGWLTRSTLARRTKSHYRVALRGFGKWLAKVGHTVRNPFEGLEKIKGIEGDRKLVRRALAPEEFDRLITTTEQSLRKFCRLTGPQRAVLYQFAAATGLRRQEIASLWPCSFRLDSTPPHVQVAAAYTKNRKVATQPLPSALVPLLREYLRGRPANEPVWAIDGRRTNQMMRADLEEAGLPLLVAGETFDFHSLRGQFATRLAKAGVGLAAAQKLLRHSTPALTANVYTHLGLSDLGREVEKLG